MTRMVLAALGAVLALMAGLVAGVPAQASGPAAVPAADGSVGPVRIVLDALSPAIPGDKATLRIRGRVINTSAVTVEDVSVRLRRSSFPLTERAGIADVVEAPLTFETGEPTDVPLPGTRVVVAGQLAPGELRRFSMRVAVRSIGFTEAGVYPVAVEALGREPRVDEFDTRKGIVRTFVPWFPADAEVEPIRLAWLWPLAGWPAQSASGVMLDDQTPRELAPDGRLGQLLSIGSRHQATVSWIADPALLQEAEQISSGYQVLRNGTVSVGGGEDDAAAWLELLGQSTRLTGLRTLPYADVDASAITRGGMSNDVVRAVTRGPRIASQVLGDPTAGEVYWAPFGRLDRSTVDVLASSGVSAVILSADAMPSTSDSVRTEGQPTAALPSDVGTIRAVLTDPALTSVLDLPQSTAGEIIAARQRFLAETALVAQTLESSDRTLVAAPSSVRWRGKASLLAPLLKATRAAPWLQPVSLTELLEEPAPSTSRRRGGYGEMAREAELGKQYVATIARTTEQLGVFTSVIDNPTGITEPYSEALLRAESSGWRTQPETGIALLDSIRTQLTEQTEQVRVLSEGTITFSGDSGKVPVTIANDLDRSVTVGLALRGRPLLRLDSQPLEGIEIEAGKMASVEVDARVIGGDPLSVGVQLLSPAGEDYGSPASITVTSTAYARAASYVVVAAFVAILIFVVVGVIRRIRKAQREAAGRKGADHDEKMTP